MRHLFYALGGGLGHYMRAVRTIEHFELSDRVVLLVSPQIKAWDVVVPDNVEVVCLPVMCSEGGEGFRKWFDTILAGERIDRLWLDAFPFGLFGEFQKSPAQIATNHVARILKQGNWMGGDFPTRFENTYLVEEVSANHLRFLKRHSDDVISIEFQSLNVKQASRLSTEPSDSNHFEDGLEGSFGPAPPGGTPVSHCSSFWLLTHSGEQAEVDQLVALTSEAPRVVAAVSDNVMVPDGFSRVPSPQPWYAAATRIVSGCGFNTMLETRAYRDKHEFVPFERRFDDQFLRAEMRKHG